MNFYISYDIIDLFWINLNIIKKCKRIDELYIIDIFRGDFRCSDCIANKFKLASRYRLLVTYVTAFATPSPFRYAGHAYTPVLITEFPAARDVS